MEKEALAIPVVFMSLRIPRHCGAEESITRHCEPRFAGRGNLEKYPVKIISANSSILLDQLCSPCCTLGVLAMIGFIVRYRYNSHPDRR